MKSQLRLVVEMSSKQAAVKNIFGLIPIEGKFPKDSAYRVLVEERDFAGALKSLCTTAGGQSFEEFAMMTHCGTIYAFLVKGVAFPSSMDEEDILASLIDGFTVAFRGDAAKAKRKAASLLEKHYKRVVAEKTQQEKKGEKVGSGHVVMDKAGGVKAISDAVPAKAMFNDEDSDEEEPDNTMNAAQQHVAGAVNDGFTSLNNACLIVASDIGAESPMSKVSMVTEKVSQSSLVERLKHVNAGDSAAKSLPLHIMFARYFNEAILGNLSPEEHFLAAMRAMSNFTIPFSAANAAESLVARIRTNVDRAITAERPLLVEGKGSCLTERVKIAALLECMLLNSGAIEKEVGKDLRATANMNGKPKEDATQPKISTFTEATTFVLNHPASVKSDASAPSEGGQRGHGIKNKQKSIKGGRGAAEEAGTDASSFASQETKKPGKGSKGKGKGKGKGVCARCNEPGHYWKDCKMPWQDWSQTAGSEVSTKTAVAKANAALTLAKRQHELAEAEKNLREANAKQEKEDSDADSDSGGDWGVSFMGKTRSWYESSGEEETSESMSQLSDGDQGSKQASYQIKPIEDLLADMPKESTPQEMLVAGERVFRHTLMAVGLRAKRDALELLKEDPSLSEQEHEAFVKDAIILAKRMATRDFSIWKANALMRMKVSSAGAADDGAAEGHDSGGWS